MLSRRSVLAGSAAATLAATLGTSSGASAAAPDRVGGAAPDPAGGAAPDRVGGAASDLAGGASPDRVDPAALQAALDKVVATGATAALARVDSPSGSWCGASGVVEVGRPAPAPADGRFRVGSITKTFVATVVLQLVGEGRLRLEDSLERWLPGVIPGGIQITIRNLLQHTSGVPDYTQLMFPTLEDVLRNRYRTYRPEELVAVVADEPLEFPPGTSWKYSNTNYLLLGMIIRRVTRRQYGTEVAARILRPLRLADTEVPGTTIAIHGPHAHGYEVLLQDGVAVPVDFTEINPSVAFSAGEIISTTADLNRFYRALLRGRLLRPAQLAEMLGHLAGDSNYGLGIYQQPLPGGPTLWGHTGSIFGYRTFAFSTADTATQFTLSVNPWLGDAGPAVLDLVLTAFGVTPPAARTTAATPALPLMGIHVPAATAR